MQDNKSSYSHIRKYYDQFSKSYDKKRTQGYFEFINRLEAQLVLELCRDKKVLEVGCGTGVILEKIASQAKRAAGVDLSPEMVARARDKGLEAYQANATKIGFKDNSFDLVYSFKVLAHIPQAREAISEIRRVCKPKGLMILEFYNPYSIKFIVNKISTLFSHNTVYIRYDAISEIQGYLGDDLEIERVRGVRIITPAALILKIPVISKLFRVLEQRLCDTGLKWFGGYFVVVVRNNG